MPAFSLDPCWGHCARGTQPTGHLGWCHGWNRFNLKIFGKGYIQRFLTLFYRYFKREVFHQNVPEPPNFHSDIQGGTLPVVPGPLGTVVRHSLHIGTTCTLMHAFPEFFSIFLCKYLQPAQKPQIPWHARFFT